MADATYENLRVTQQAYIGAGGQSDAQLHIIRSDNAEAKVLVEKAGTDALKLSLSENIATISTLSKVPLQLQSVGNNGIYISEKGFVGVAGITNPNFNLDVKGIINTEQYYKNGQPWKITGGEIANNTITSINIKDGTITQGKLAFPVGGSQWENGNNNSIFYSRGNVGIATSSPNFNLDINGIINATQFYKNGQPWQAAREEILDNAINAPKIEDGSVGTAKLSNGAVTDVKIADGNVNSAKLANGAVTTDKIADKSITVAKLAFPLPDGSGSSQWINASNGIYYNGGNIGIGTNNPQDKLDLAGNLRILTGSNPIRFTSAWSDFPESKPNQAEISNDTGNFKTLMIVGNKSADGNVRKVSVWDYLQVNGNMGIRKDITGQLGSVLTLENGLGGQGAGSAIDFNGYDVGQNPPTARIQSLDDGNSSSHIAFHTKTPGKPTNPLKERLRIQSGGNVGVGITNPEAFLHVFSPVGNSGGNVKLFPTSGKGIDFSYDGGDDSIFGFTNYGTEQGDTRFQWQGQDNSVRNLLIITNKGDVSGRLINTSSRTLKENITDFSTQEAIETLASLNPVKFNYREDNQKQLKAGFIAEDVPELLAAADRKGICALEIVAVLTKVIQQQQEQLSCLKERLNALEASV